MRAFFPVSASHSNRCSWSLRSHSQQKQQQANINTAMHAFLQSKLFSVSMAIFCPLYMVKENCCALTVNELTQSL